MCIAPAIGNAHGMYRAAPKLDNQRVTDIVAATGCRWRSMAERE